MELSNMQLAFVSLTTMKPPNPSRHDSPQTVLFGAFSGSTLVGIVSAERDTRKKVNHKALVFRMFVHPDAAGCGIGRRLLEDVVQTMTTIEMIRYLYLTVLASNPRAIHLYSSLGFKEFARESGAVRINDEYIDELQMALHI